MAESQRSSITERDQTRQTVLNELQVNIHQTIPRPLFPDLRLFLSPVQLVNPTRFYQIPQRIGYFSSRVYDLEKPNSYHQDFSSLPCLRSDYYLLENVNLQASFSYLPDQFDTRDSTEPDHILQWIRDSHYYTSLQKCNFVSTSPNILRSLMAAPFHAKPNWAMVVIKLGQTIYLFSYETKKSVNAIISRAHSNYFSQQFLELVTVCTKSEPGLLTGKKNKFYIVNELDIGQHKILYPMPVDCIIDESMYDKPLSEMHFAQIRYRPHQYPNQNVGRFRKFLEINWWISAFLSQTDALIVGEKSSEYVVKEVKTLRANDLIQSTGRLKWSPNQCFQYLEAVLSLIKDKIVQENAVYRVRWDKDRRQFRCHRTGDPVNKYLSF